MPHSVSRDKRLGTIEARILRKVSGMSQAKFILARS